jgi:hypothetical protein
MQTTSSDGHHSSTVQCGYCQPVSQSVSRKLEHSNYLIINEEFQIMQLNEVFQVPKPEIPHLSGNPRHSSGNLLRSLSTTWSPRNTIHSTVCHDGEDGGCPA